MQASASPHQHDKQFSDVDGLELFFEVSRHTKRLHAFRQADGGFEHLGSVPPVLLRKAIEQDAAHAFPFALPAVRSAASMFWTRWGTLSSGEQRALWARKEPLRLSLAGFLPAVPRPMSAPSTTRVAHRDAARPAAPAGATTQKYVYLLMPGGARLRYALHIGADGSWLCRTCSIRPACKQHPHELAEPLVGCLHDLSCSNECHDRCVRCIVARLVPRLTRMWCCSFRAQTSPAHLRRMLYLDERGFCQLCGRDCDDLAKRLYQGSEGPKVPLEDLRTRLVQLEPLFRDKPALMLDVLRTGCVALHTALSRHLPDDRATQRVLGG